jgi:hypothetical protein
VVYLINENEVESKKTEQNRSVAKHFVIFLMAPYLRHLSRSHRLASSFRHFSYGAIFASSITLAPPGELVSSFITLAPPGELVSSSFTLAPHGEFVFFIFHFLSRQVALLSFFTEIELLTM